MNTLWTRKSVLAFFAVGFGVPWLGWTTLAVTGLGEEPSITATALFYTGDFMTVAGFVAAFVAAGHPGFRSLLLRTLRVRAPLGWALFALFVPLCWTAVPALVMGAFGEGIGRVELGGLAMYFAPGVLLALTTGPIGEEAGWRGFLQPRVMRRFSPLRGSLIIGLIWSGWHVPLYWDTVFADVGEATRFTIATAATSVLFTILWAHTRASVFWAILFHWSLNITGTVVGRVFPDLPRVGLASGWGVSAMTIATAVVAYLAIGRKRLDARLSEVLDSLADESIDRDRDADAAP